MIIELTPTQYDSLCAFLHLIDERAREPTINKSIDINLHSISVASKRSYTSVRVALTNLKNKLGV